MPSLKRILWLRYLLPKLIIRLFFWKVHYLPNTLAEMLENKFSMTLSYFNTDQKEFFIQFFPIVHFLVNGVCIKCLSHFYLGQDFDLKLFNVADDLEVFGKKYRKRSSILSLSITDSRSLWMYIENSSLWRAIFPKTIIWLLYKLNICSTKLCLLFSHQEFRGKSGVYNEETLQMWNFRSYLLSFQRLL